MRRIVAVMALVAVAFSVVACGGGGAETTATTTSSTPAKAPVKKPTAAAPTDKSPKQVVTNEQFPTDPTSVPTSVLDRLKAKQPMLVYFYDSSDAVTNDERAQIDEVMEDYRGLIDLVAYDVRTGPTSATTPTDPALKKAMELAGLLKVTYQPYVLFVDKYGRITGRFSGFVDSKLLEREVLRATS